MSGQWDGSSKRIPKTQPSTLIATLGTEPQVVTAALDLLLRQGEHISQVVVIHTVASPESGIPDAVARLRKAFEFDTGSHNVSPQSIPLHLVPLCDTSDRTLEDVQTPDQTQAAYRCLYNMVRTSKLEGDRIHLLIAGGRKTLALFGMAVAQLLFDENDRLWHLYSAGDFLESKRLHPLPGDEVHLIPIPVILWSQVSPILTDLSQVEDPLAAIEWVRSFQIAERLQNERTFVLGSLTPAEARVVALLVQRGWSDNQIAESLVISPRTVEGHLRSAYMKAEAHWELTDVSRTTLIALLSLFYSMQIGHAGNNLE